MDKWTPGEDGKSAGSDERRYAASMPRLRAGDHAPNFALPDQDGRRVSLTGILEHGPVILTFLEGRKQADAEAQLQAFTRCATAIAEHGGLVVAISPVARSRVTGTGAFAVLHDARAAVAGRYGLCRSRKTGTVPATFVIDRRSTIVLSLTAAVAGSNLTCVNVVSALAALRRIAGRRP
jgi:peroxiredoxin